jgi:hypothetical protein
MDILTTIAIGRIHYRSRRGDHARGTRGHPGSAFPRHQREGYYRDGVAEDWDEHDQGAVFFLAGLRRTDPAKSVIVSSARLIRGREGHRFEFPCQKGHRFELPEPDVPAALREELGRVVSEMPRGFGVDQLVTTFGLRQVISEYHERAAGQEPLRVGLATIKRSLLRDLRSLGLPLYEIRTERSIRPLAPWLPTFTVILTQRCRSTGSSWRWSRRPVVSSRDTGEGQPRHAPGEFVERQQDRRRISAGRKLGDGDVAATERPGQTSGRGACALCVALRRPPLR